MKKIKLFATDLFDKLKLEEEPRLLTIVFSDGEAHIFSATESYDGCGLEEETISIVDEKNKAEKEVKELKNNIRSLERKKKQIEKAIKVLKN